MPENKKAASRVGLTFSEKKRLVELRRIFAGNGKEQEKPDTAQKTITFRKMFRDGICQVTHKDSKDTKAIFGRYLRLNYIFKDPGDIIVDNLYTNLTNKFAELRRKRGAITRAELEAVVNSAISKGSIFSGLSLSVGYSKIENGYVENEQKVKKEI